MNIEDVSDDMLANLINVLKRQPEAEKVFYYHGTDPLGNPQHGGYCYVFTRKQVLDEQARRTS